MGHLEYAMKNILMVVGAICLLSIGGCLLMCGGMGMVARNAAENVRLQQDETAAAPAAPSQVSHRAATNNGNSEKIRTIVKPTEEPEEVYSNITWDEIDDIYNARSKVTTIQKNELWKGYKGKRIRWSGSVSEIADTFGTLTLQVKMNPQTLTSDLLIRMKPEQRSAALALAKDQPITFTGTLDDWGTITGPARINPIELQGLPPESPRS